MLRNTFLVLIFASNFNCFCASFCAVRVLVTDHEGKPAAALVRLVDSGGKVVKQVIAERGEAEFCDFGFGDHSIDVGASTCAHIIIPHVRVVFGRTLTFRVYRNTCRGDVSLIGCTTYFRIIDPGGRGLSGVSVSSDPPGVNSEDDDYGRVQINIDDNESRLLLFSKPGYVLTRVDFNCLRPAYAEQSVTLIPVEE